MGGRLALALLTAALALSVVTPVCAQPQGGRGGPTYQRKSMYDDDGRWQHHDWRRRPQPQFTSEVNASSFQRPYPYHLDYYRMKWGGSYAPYFGNLYGPPNYFFVGTPWFGGSSPFLGYNGYWGGGFDGGYNGFGGPFTGGVPYGPWAGQFGAPNAPPFDGGGAAPAPPAAE